MNEKTYQEYRGVDNYEVTKTMKIGYLTQKQMAFVYRLICSMRGISEQDMLSNLTREAKDAVQDCDHYAKDYFNLDFKSENYRKKIADVTSKKLLKLQNGLDEIEEEMNTVESRIRRIEDSIQVIREEAVIALRSELEHITQSSSYDPCMKFLEGIKIENWKKKTLSTVSEKHKEIKKLHKAVKMLKKASLKKAVNQAIQR